MTLVFGDFSVIYVFLPWVSKSYGFKTETNGKIIIFANIFGLLGCILVGFIKKRLTYKKICTFALVGLAVSLGMILLSF